MTHHVRHAFLALFGLGLCVALCLPARTAAWSAIGGTLGLRQRDVRVFDNFANPEAHDNTAPDPNFPGATGAALAIWKGVAEWGSTRRADGEGDPTQSGGMGSGGANFDSTWQGAASGPGTTDENIASQISGGSLGILAFTELPIQDGWRIRFYTDSFIWHDGPADIPPLTADHKDIQGVMAHEYGHALGLGHTGFAGMTMFPSGSGTNTEKRSIENDDVDGVRALYGPAAATKPVLDGYTVSGGTVTLHGARFAASGNQVWFTDGAPGHDGTPLTITGLASNTARTQIVLALPAGAASGEVLVKVPGTDGSALSNAYPFDPLVSSCVAPALYGTAKTTSQGTLPELFTTGRPRLSLNDFAIGTGGGIANARGILFSGAARAAMPFRGGTLWVTRPVKREQPFTFDFLGGITLAVPVTPALVGTTRCYQIWFQDAGDAFGAGISNAVEVTFCP